jgi:hypothetical protein
MRRTQSGTFQPGDFARGLANHERTVAAQRQPLEDFGCAPAAAEDTDQG